MSRDRDNRVSLLVRNLPLDTRAEEVRARFEKYGRVRDVYLPRDYYTGRPKGFGFIEFLDPRDADDAIYHLDRSMFGGREITVCPSKESRKTPREMSVRDETAGVAAPRSRSRRTSRSPRRRRSYSRSRSPRRDRRRSRSRSRSRGNGRRGRSPSRSLSRSPVRKARSLSRSPARARSRSKSPARSRSRSRSRSPARSRSLSRSPPPKGDASPTKEGSVGEDEPRQEDD